MGKTRRAFLRLVALTVIMMMVLPAAAASTTASTWKKDGSAWAHSRGGNWASVSLSVSTRPNPTDLRIRVDSKTGAYKGKMNIDYFVSCQQNGSSVTASDSFKVNSNEPFIIKPIANVDLYDRCTVSVHVSNTFSEKCSCFKNFDPLVKVQSRYAG